ncbi:ABC transporter permease [uncultured Sphaerochaeta sp.]|uniref:ABC transporter permease n=1 Tax=uncultured Sphaerochaeta sp. TaxID=886478 RepID=UPI002A0A226C|nr:ABC transporter permease [uncultured Sphaerochaeta sp.]
MNIRKRINRTETYILIALVLFCVLVQVRSGQFFTANNIVDILRSLTIPGMFCICELLVLLSGGIDVSFPSIAALSMYLVSTRMIGYTGNIVVFFIVGTFLGLVMGALNGYLVGKFHFNALIVTLGTSSLYTGILNGVFLAHESPIPAPMLALGKAKLFSVYNQQLQLRSNMPIAFIFFLTVVLLTFVILHYTKLGRGIYAIGGDINSANRVGFNVFGIQMFVYCFAGGLAGFVGVARASMMLNCAPTNMVGMDMTVIAACVLGGASVTGGVGTISGVLLGMGLMTVMSNSLILIGISTYWQRVFTGLIIIVGTGVSTYQALQKQRRLIKRENN